MHSKRYREIKTKTPAEIMDLAAAVGFLKENARQSFDETVEVHVRLGVDTTKSDQTVRGTVQLPSGLPKKPRVAVFTANPEEQEKSRAAGAVEAGGEELVNKVIKDGTLEADIVVAVPAMMPQIAKAAKILGPKGLMPSPKAGTVTDNPGQVVGQLLGGQASFKMDQHGNAHAAIAKVSWDQEKIVANIRAWLEAMRNAKPAAAKGELIRSVTIKTTMSPGIRVSG